MPWYLYYYPPHSTTPIFTPLILAVVWSLIWKGMALYRSARNGQKGWFIALLILQTMGILEIVYILFFSASLVKPKKKA